MPSRSQENSTRGFTLIELMIVVLIIGVLAAIAYPSYRDHVLRSHRVDAQTAMMTTVQALERCYTRHNAYLGASCPDVAVQSDPARYNITITDRPDDDPPQTFTVRAEPQGAQDQERCHGSLAMEINQAGQRTPQNCW